MIVMALLKAGRFLEIGFDRIWTLANPLVWEVADIFYTYVYRMGLQEGAYTDNQWEAINKEDGGELKIYSQPAGMTNL